MLERGEWVGYDRPGLDASVLITTGAGAARALLQELTVDRSDPTACLSSRPCSGVCRLCGQIKKLSFEHIPLQAAGNNRRARAVSMEQLIDADDPFGFPSSGWRSAQRGAGAHVLCKRCNEFAGAEYGGAYSRFSRWLDEGLSQLGGRMPHEGFVLRHPKLPLGDIARAALVSLIGVSVGHAVIRRDPQLRDVIMDGACGLPDGLRLGVTVVAGSKIRHSPPHALFQSGQGWTVFVEFAAQPLAWNLSYRADGLVPLDRCADVSSWLDLAPGQQGPLDLTVPTGVVFTTVPGDYRDEKRARRDA